MPAAFISWPKSSQDAGSGFRRTFRPRYVQALTRRGDFLRDESKCPPWRGVGGDVDPAGACVLESLPLPAIRYRRLLGAVVRGLSRAEPLDGLWPVCDCRLAARFLACRRSASRGCSMDHRAGAPQLRLWRAPVRPLRHGDGAGADDIAAVARRHSAHRYFRRHLRARAPSPHVSSGDAHAQRAYCARRICRLCRRNA